MKAYRSLFIVAAALFAASIPPARAAVPVIERVDFLQTGTITPASMFWSSSAATVWVRDADGASDIEHISVDHLLYSQGGPGWIVEAPDLVRLTTPFTLLIDGTCLVTADDASAGIDTLSFETPSLPDPAPAVLSPAFEYPVRPNPAVTFAWTGMPVNGETTLTVRRQLTGDQIWSYTSAGASGSVAYNADGTALEPLRRGFTYGWSLAAEAVVDDGVTDPRVHLSIREEAEDRFIIYSQTPTIEQVSVWRQRDAWMGRPPQYSESVCVSVTDTGTCWDLASVDVTDPEGVLHSAPGADALWTYGDEYRVDVQLFLSEDWLTEPPAAGTYAIVATDDAGEQCQLTATTVSEVPAPQLLSPALGSVTDDLTPTFRWDPGAENSTAVLVLWEQGTAGNLLQLGDLTGGEYTFHADYEWQRQELLPGRNYLWMLTVYAQEPTSDERVKECFELISRSRFTEYEPWPALPQLEGKLAFDTRFPSADSGSWADMCWVELYDPDPTVRQWLQPAYAEHPSWSPDGSKIVYSDGSICVDPLDGSLPIRVATGCLLDPCWSPDGSQIAYARNTGYRRFDVWVMNADGTGDYAVAEGDTCKRQVGWSPDGQWISYRNLTPTPDPDVQGLWLVRPDGTEMHQLVASGVQGYPGYAVEYIGEAGWAPDAQRLVATFTAALGTGLDAPRISGIGVVSPGGGMLKPIFLTPAGIVCCPEPRSPSWSGGGTKVVFSSGHHLPINPAWTNGHFESGVEVWMINADGSGEPTRLTYNYGLDQNSSWWAPSPFPDVLKGNWAYCAIAACKQEGIVRGYADGRYHPERTVTRGQMAIYIARGLAGGEAYVPSGAAYPQPTFPDVGADDPAYRYVEYCVADGVVQGYEDGRYHPERTVNRGQMAIYIARSIATPTGEAGLEGYTGPEMPTFSDVGMDSPIYRYVEYCAENGVVQGYWNGTYRPGTAVTREQMAVYIARAFRLPM